MWLMDDQRIRSERLTSLRAYRMTPVVITDDELPFGSPATVEEQG
jgi:hypothetical protein